MITIDRSSNRPIYDQLLDQLRFQIASGKYRVGDRLPSTRGLGQQLDLSFHTVRKAYQQLEEEGLLVSRVGSGFRVAERVPLQKAEQKERGAGILQESLQKLIGLGLEEREITFLFEEQLTFLEPLAQSSKIVFAGAYREQAETCAKQIGDVLQKGIEPVVVSRLEKHQDAEYIITPYAYLNRAMQASPISDVIGVVVYTAAESLTDVARLLPHQTLGLVTRLPDAIEPLMRELRRLTGFSGQTVALTVDARSSELTQLFRQVDMLVYTPQSKRRLPSIKDIPSAALHPIVSADSIDLLRRTIAV